MDPSLAAVRSRLLMEYEGKGHWARHHGDATAWAPAVLLHGEATFAEREAARGTVARARSLLAGLLRPGAQREEAALGTLALLASAKSGARADRAAVQAALTAANAGAAARGGYLDRPEAPVDPTSVTAALAYGNLLLASALRGPARILHGRTAEWLLDRLGQRVFDGPNAYFRARPGDRTVHALPNLLAVCALARASRLRRRQGLLDLAKRVEGSLRAALYGDDGAWLTSEEASPVYMLSVQNFAGMAYAEMHAAAPREGWDRRAREPLRFATTRALGKDLLAHHWDAEHGRSEEVCVGCNWQTLRVEQMIEAGRAL